MSESKIKIQYRAMYKGNGTDPSVKAGGSGFQVTLEDAEKSAMQHLKYFNQKIAVENIEGKEVKKTVRSETAIVWIDVYHDGELFESGKPMSLPSLDVARPGGAPREESYLAILKEQLTDMGKEDVSAMIDRHPGIVLKGIQQGLSLRCVRETALAIQEADASFAPPAEEEAPAPKPRKKLRTEATPVAIEDLQGIDADDEALRDVMASVGK